jgi:hypothetical protein
VRKRGDKRRLGDRVNREGFLAIMWKGEAVLATYYLPYRPIRLPKRTASTHSPWRWQLKCLPKRWITINIRRGLSPKAGVTQRWTSSLHAVHRVLSPSNRQTERELEEAVETYILEQSPLSVVCMTAEFQDSRLDPSPRKHKHDLQEEGDS